MLFQGHRPRQDAGGSTGQDPTLVGPRWPHWLPTSGCSSLPLSLQFCLHCAHIPLFLFLFSVSATYLFFLEVPRVSGYPGSSQEWFQECYFLLLHFGAVISGMACVLVACLFPHTTCYPSGALLVVVSWSFLSRLHGHHGFAPRRACLGGSIRRSPCKSCPCA